MSPRTLRCAPYLLVAFSLVYLGYQGAWSSAPLASAAPDVPAQPLPTPEPAPALRASTLVAVLDPTELSALDAGGFSFARLALGAAARTARELRSVPALSQIFATLEADVHAAARPFPLAKVTSVYGYRLFDAGWFGSTEMSFALVGVFNRLDRRVFYPGTCGEVRFVYRLAYATEQGGMPMASRLPLTLNLVFLIGSQGDADCSAAARAWQAPANLSSAQQTRWLLETGALSQAARQRWQLKSIESNLQTFRLQSSVHPSMAGHIEYGLRVFHPKAKGGSGFVPAPLENMPDVAGLKRNTALRAQLLAYLKQDHVLSDIDRGSLQLPEQFLARQATSFSPRGLARLHNRPFRQLFKMLDFADVRLAAYQTIRSPAALLRRLDGASCVGCHQSRSIAGFHHIGQDAPTTATFNALLSGSSAHLQADLVRRRSYVEAVALGQPPDEFRPLPERQGVGSGQGAPCGLGDPGFADWRCAAGLRCVSLEDTEIGACLAEGRVGSPCEYGNMASAARPHQDRIDKLARHACGEAQTCDTNFQGFAQGSCSASCRSGSPHNTCADFLDIDGFQKCLRQRRSFDQCARESVFAAGMPACDAKRACRQDYVCARTQTAGVGACLPPYFVLQLRLDGYPIMR